MIRNLVIYIILCGYVFADALDNVLIEQIQEMQELKEEKRKQKHQNSNEKQDIQYNNAPEKVMLSNEETSNPPQVSESTKSNDTNSLKSTEKQHNETYKSKNSSNNSTKRIIIKNDNHLYWFTGAGLNGYYETRLNSKNIDFFAFSLHFGGFYYLNSSNGFKIYAIGSYKNLNRADFFTVGGGIDYFYDFKSMGIFFGVYADVPIKNNVWNSTDTIAQAGISLYTLQNLRFEFIIGLPVINSGNLRRAFAYGAKLQYIFDKK